VASPDPAFLWETEVLRSSRDHSSGDARPRHRVAHDAGDWLTLREASEITGVPTSTIRKWARHKNIPSFLEQNSDGYLRIVSMSGIKRWTDEIGRDMATLTPDKGPRGERPQPAGEVEPTAEDEPRIPEGSMLVPLDAWNRMLNQLGNLHEAGQALAEARERAAKAETETHFLKERLGELRNELEQARAAPDADPRLDQMRPSGTGAVSLTRKIYRSWRKRRRG
jgi:DNA-binding transcriptional MerR regulator